MKNSYKYLFYIILFFLLLNTNLVTNMWMLLTDSSNYIPEESNIVFFTPTQIDSGSGGYWLYGKDLNNYYHFSLVESNVYYLIGKKNKCPQFSEANFETWCEKNKRQH